MPLIPCESLQSRRLLDIAAYLDSKRRNGGSPDRADIDPVSEIPKLAQHLVLLERTASGRFKFRLVGSIVADIQGRDLTGQWLDEIAMDRTHASWTPGLPALFATHALLCGVGRPPWSAREHIEFEWISQRLNTPPGASEIVVLALD